MTPESELEILKAELKMAKSDLAKYRAYAKQDKLRIAELEKTLDSLHRGATKGSCCERE